MVAYDGRPHWGKIHTRTADDLRIPSPASTTSWPMPTASTRTAGSPIATCGKFWGPQNESTDTARLLAGDPTTSETRR